MMVAGAFLVAVGTRADTLPFPPNAEYSDAAVSHWPAALYFQRSVQAGEFPLWRPLLMSGQPFAANPLNKVWYPPQWLAAVLPAALHLNVLIWLHLVLAGVGMRAFGQALGLSAAVANVMGVAYMLTPRMIAAIGAGHLDIGYAMAWFPVVMWATARLVNGGYRWQEALLVAVSAALCFLADIRMSVFVFGTAGAFALWSLLTRRHVVRLSSFLLAALTVFVCCLGLTAVQWLPLLALSPHLSRSVLSATDASVFSLTVPQLLGVLLPRQPGSHEVMLYSGLMVLISQLIGINHLFRSGRWGIALFWWGLIAFALLYALGLNSPLWTTLTSLSPSLLWLRVPARIWIVVVFALLVLAGYGWQALSERKGLPAPRRALLVGVVGVLVALELLWTDVALIQPRPQREWLDSYAPIAHALIADGATKFYSPSYGLPQQAAAYWTLPDFGGVDPFQLRDYIPAFESATGTTARGYTITLPPFDGPLESANRDAVIDPDKLAAWGVSHVVAAFPIDHPDLTLVQAITTAQLSRGATVYIYRNRRATLPASDWQRPQCGGSGDSCVDVVLQAVAAGISGFTLLIVTITLALPSIRRRLTRAVTRA
jgi:hypothetical protein